jgi:outer membrane protein insertion porin family
VTSGLRNLYNLQFFSAIVPEVVPGSEENLVDLIINVEEQSTTSIELGLTFSGVTDPDDFPLSLFVKLQDSNIRGTGKTVSVNTTVSPDQQSLSLGYGDSWFFGLPVSVSAGFDISHRNLTTLQNLYLPDGNVNSDEYYLNYEQFSIALSGGVGRRWYPNFAMFVRQGGISFRFIQNYYDYDLFEPYDNTIARYKGAFHPQNSIYVSAYLDDRDINYDPSKGWFVKQRFSWNGLLGFDIGTLPKEEEFFLRTDSQAEGYITLFDIPLFNNKWNFKWVLADFVTASFIVPATEIGETNQLYIDGMFNGRGWQNIYLTNRGNSLIYNATELRMPLVPGFLALDFFFDMIWVKDRYEKQGIKDDWSTLSGKDVYYSFGPGLRFSIAQFPLRFLFANTFQIIDGKTEWRNGKGPEWQFVLSFNITNR